MNKKNRYITAIVFCLAIGLSSCYNEDSISSELGIDDLKPVDSSEPLDHYIYEFYNQYGSYITYEYDTLDYQWDFSTKKEVTFAQQKDKEILFRGIQHVENVLFGLYSEDFKKQYLPTKIMLADSINEPGSRGKLDKFSESGTAYIAVGKIRDGIVNINDEDFNQSKAAINYNFWMGYLRANDKLIIPSSFYKPSEGYYHVNLKTLSENEDNSKIDIKNYGFWADKDGKPNGGYYFWTPDEEVDVEQFFEKILSHTKEEMTAMMEGYPKLQDKYNILINHIQKEFDFDIQSIGDKNK